MTDTEDEEMTLPRALELVIEASRHCPIGEVEDFDGQAIDICSDNYRIMAAAPDLLETLEEAYGQLKETLIALKIPIPQDSFNRYDAAISKTRGEQ